MKFRCRVCGRTDVDPTRMTDHVHGDHGKADLGWYIERVPEVALERPVVWLSNLPLRVRSWRGE